MKGGETLLGLWFSSAQHFIQMLLSYCTAALLKLSLARQKLKKKKVYTNQPRFFLLVIQAPPPHCGSAHSWPATQFELLYSQSVT